MSAAAAETHASILSLPQLVNNDAGLVRRGRYLTATFLVEAGDTEFRPPSTRVMPRRR